MSATSVSGAMMRFSSTLQPVAGQVVRDIGTRQFVAPVILRRDGDNLDALGTHQQRQRICDSAGSGAAAVPTQQRAIELERL